MENRVYYGEYSLKHWIDLILKKNLILPAYQRLFVWNEKKVKTLIDTFQKKQFVPPVTIGAFKIDNTNQNLILDGQQRLTSILLAYLGIFPDEATFKKTRERFADENGDIDEESEQLDNIYDWNFDSLTKKGRNKQVILEKLEDGNYKKINFEIDDNFLKNTFLGFSYLVPYITDEQVQQKYYSSVFRNINIQGEPLLLQESRASLYFLEESLVEFFSPNFCKSLIVKNINNSAKADFVRFLSLLSQYRKDGSTSKVARGFKPQMEKYYEEYIYSVVGENSSSMFPDFSTIFPNKEFKPRFERLEEIINSLEIPKEYSSIIDMDVYLFGLIYIVVFDNKAINIAEKASIQASLTTKINEFKNDASHTKAPSALKYLKLRINASLEIYKRHENEQP
ncbi:MAG: DUF262 domain-containing protein [Bacteroidetes bacterium]|nr:DUF262 domain-containing protein [Bacteroidota bacterium]MBK9672816.1 DUF262 domain-containing protein [Bacteroidota bacterium]MBK9800927.1 DUF262 domain-containing protein [Bacteroidota bacterium]MBP6412480.1 DUF262 domain-containing protein [Bacteroidia bacterium]